MTAFNDFLFPLDIALRSAGGPQRRTEIVALGSGREERNARWAHSRRRYDAGYGVIGTEQLAWFRATLEKAVTARERVICFCHFALLQEAAAHHRMATPEPILDILDRTGCVVAWFAGHDHAGGYALRNGVHHVTVKGLVEAPEAGAYGLVELFPDHLRETGLGAEPSRDLPIPAR